MLYEVQDTMECGAFQIRDPYTAGQQAMAAQDGLHGTNVVKIGT
jgi:hypothetical protein